MGSGLITRNWEDTCRVLEKQNTLLWILARLPFIGTMCLIFGNLRIFLPFTLKMVS